MSGYKAGKVPDQTSLARLLGRRLGTRGQEEISMGRDWEETACGMHAKKNRLFFPRLAPTEKDGGCTFYHNTLRT